MPVQAFGFGFSPGATRFGGPAAISRFRGGAMPAPEAAVFSAPGTGSPARTPQTAG